MPVPDEVFQVYNQVVDDMINKDFGVTCTLIYPDKRVPCDNCFYDTMAKKSTNTYNGTGPQPFSNCICPWCEGLGFKAIPVTEDIMLRVYSHRRYWIKVGNFINAPDGTVQTIGFITDQPKIEMAQKIRINSQLGGYGNYIYSLLGEPFTSGFTNNRYIVCYWKRIQ